jgi:glycine/D-amino acid oxidase-like deaminating enzyme
MPTHARLVIIGAGIFGSAAAYHLTRLGWECFAATFAADPQ